MSLNKVLLVLTTLAPLCLGQLFGDRRSSFGAASTVVDSFNPVVNPFNPVVDSFNPVVNPFNPAVGATGVFPGAGIVGGVPGGVVAPIVGGPNNFIPGVGGPGACAVLAFPQKCAKPPGPSTALRFAYVEGYCQQFTACSLNSRCQPRGPANNVFASVYECEKYCGILG